MIIGKFSHLAFKFLGEERLVNTAASPFCFSKNECLLVNVIVDLGGNSLIISISNEFTKTVHYIFADQSFPQRERLDILWLLIMQLLIITETLLRIWRLLSIIQSAISSPRISES